jgi:membrane-associated phospholipid phosphatase
MFYLLTLFISAQAGWLSSVNDALFHAINHLAGRSFVFDNLVDLAIESNLVKAALIGACFMFAWLAGGDPAVIARRRRILLVTLISSVFVVACTKTLSKTIFLPRPFILSQQTYHLEGNQLVETPRVEFNVPLDQENQKDYKDLLNGDVADNDLGSFPSDHAGFYITLALGIFLAYRRIGMLALAWTLIVTLGSRIITGEHSPLDVAVGSGVGIAILLSMQFIFGNWAKRFIDPIVNWTMTNSALAAALLFVVLFEASNTLDNVRRVGHVGKDIAKHLVGKE